MATISGLEGKSVIVTGGASGIGRATVELLLENGANVTVGDVNADAVAALESELAAESSTRLEVTTTDVTDERAVEGLVGRAVGRFGGLHGAVNSAGAPPRQVVLHEMPVEQWQACQAVNLTGQFLCMKHEVRAMIETGGGGAIVAVSSAAADGALPASAEYVASKAGLNGLVRAAALDAASSGIRVNGIMPGAVQTPMADFANHDNEGFAAILAAIPLGRVAAAEEAAAVAGWLVSDLASYVTGVVVAVDGGILMR